MIRWVAAFALLAILGTTPCARSAAPNDVVKLKSSSEQSRQIQTAVVRRMTISNQIDTTAVIEPDIHKVAHVSPRIRARVVRLSAELGQQLKPGDAIAILSSIELGKAKADYLESRALQGIAQQHLAREERLFKDKISSAKDVLDARANFDSAQAKYQTAREALILLIPPSELDSLTWSAPGKSLSEFALTSPIKGVLVKRDLTIGQIVGGDDEVATIIDLDSVWVLANVFEHDLAAVKVGEPAEISVDAYPKENFSGSVAYVGDTVDRSTRTVQARIDVANPNHLLKPGMFAEATITSQSRPKEVLAAPAAAVFDVDGQKSVFVQTGPETFALRKVKLGEVGHDEVEILSGLSEGDRIVTHGGLVLKSLLVNGAE